MEHATLLARTEKGRAELLGEARSLRPRQRQILFLVGDSTSLPELREKLTTNADLEDILRELVDGGFIQPLAGQPASPPPDNVAVFPASPFSQAKAYALDQLATLMGRQSPMCEKVRQASDEASLLAAVASCKKVIAAVASAAQAAALENEVKARLTG